MKKIISLILTLCLIVFLAAGCAQSAPSGETPVEEPSAAESWVRGHIENNSLFSFKYDGENFFSFIDMWEKKTEESASDAGDKIIALTYAAPDGKVSVRADITLYADSPAVDWVLHFENPSDADSGVISDILPLNSSYAVAAGETLRINHPYGSTSSENDFAPQIAELTAGDDAFIFENEGGRSSDAALPYFDLSTDEGGIIGAIGWTGGWRCRIIAKEDRAQLAAGMKETSIALHGGEEMRSPSIVLLFFEGDVSTVGHNLWRKMILNHYNPKDESGKPVTHIPVWDTLGGGVNSKDAFNFLKRVDTGEVYYEGVWIDAGWYSSDVSTGDWYAITGNWKADETRWPDGYGPLGQRMAETGREFMLWFEPERAMVGTTMLTEYPQYFMEEPASAQFSVYNLADDEATDFLTSYISDIVKEYGVTWYRQDCNMDPARRWSYVDSLEGENRTGITEIKYITNLYRFWDGLVELNPGLMIDNCAAGGRRFDIETAKRSLACWRSDYYNIEECTPEGCLMIGMNAAEWIPVSGGGESLVSGTDSAYEFRCSMFNQMLVRSYPRGGRTFTRMSEQYLKLRELMAAQYYALLAPENTLSANTACEYYDAEKGEGFIALFRPENSEDASAFIKLCGLEKEANYTLTNLDGGDPFTATGDELMTRGIEVTLNEARYSKIIHIKKA